VTENHEPSEAGAPRAQGRIVVGVDGSEPSVRALRWAAEEAVLTGASVDVVTAWTFPEHAAPLGVVPDVPWPEELLPEAQRKLDELVADTLPDSPVPVRTQVVRGGAGPVLVDAARGADLLVVGSRGRGALKELLLGSVSEYCARHALCAVVIVR